MSAKSNARIRPRANNKSYYVECPLITPCFDSAARNIVITDRESGGCRFKTTSVSSGGSTLMKNIYRAVALSLAALSLVGVSPSRAAESVLYRFTGGSDGRHPWSDLVADAKGALYGTTNAGGSEGYGAVFKLTPPAESGGPWTETVLYSFCQQSSCNDGSYPEAGLVFDNQGALYGTTSEGGEVGYGTVFD